jgi:hypothetical protein
VQDPETKEIVPKISPFNYVPDVGMVSSFPVDPMHTVYLGVLKFILENFNGSKGTSSTTIKTNVDAQNKPFAPAFVGHDVLKKMEFRQSALAKYHPSEFQRDLRAISEVSYLHFKI